MPPTWTTRPRRVWVPTADDVAAPASVHLLRSAALGLNNLHAYGLRPTLINQCLPDSALFTAAGGTDPETTFSTAVAVASWRVGTAPIPRAYTRLRGSLYGGRMSGAGPATGTFASFRVYVDWVPFTDVLSDIAAPSAVMTYTVLDARTYKTFNLPRLAAVVFVTVFAWTDGGNDKTNDPRAQLYGLELHGALE